MILQFTSELEHFSTVVEKIYDAAIDTAKWSSALNGIMGLVGASASGIHFGDSSVLNQDPTHFYGQGYTEFFASKIQAYSSIWALQSGMLNWKVGEAMHLPEILPHEEFVNGRFYKEVIQPDGQCDYIGMIALREGTRYAPITLSTIDAVGPFTKRAVELVRLLSPHICRSAKIGLALELKSLNNARLEATLNSLSAGVFLVNRDGKILFMNAAAEGQIKRDHALSVTNNRLIPKDATAAHKFAQSLSGADDAGVGGISLALPDAAGGMVATLLPLENGERQNLGGLSSPAAFAVFVQNPAIVPPVPGAAFAQLYGLTPAELRVSLAMAPSLSPQEAAHNLGLSVSTVKSHLQHIFIKTGTNKQSDLMQLLMRAGPPVSA
jgi:DNA-binding CsgD family transcriptional regulator/PAS domain-containing protein